MSVSQPNSKQILSPSFTNDKNFTDLFSSVIWLPLWRNKVTWQSEVILSEKWLYFWIRWSSNSLKHQVSEHLSSEVLKYFNLKLSIKKKTQQPPHHISVLPFCTAISKSTCGLVSSLCGFFTTHFCLSQLLQALHWSCSSSLTLLWDECIGRPHFPWNMFVLQPPQLSWERGDTRQPVNPPLEEKWNLNC